TKSTGKSPPPGSGGVVVGIARMPGILDSGAIDSSRSCCVVFVRSLHGRVTMPRSEEHTSELQSRFDLVCRLLLENKIRSVVSGELFLDPRDPFVEQRGGPRVQRRKRADHAGLALRDH